MIKKIFYLSFFVTFFTYKKSQKYIIFFPRKNKIPVAALKPTVWNPRKSKQVVWIKNK